VRDSSTVASAPSQDRPAGGWSRQQLAALDAIARWREANDRPFYFLSGYAGTGKSTLAAALDGREPDTVAYGAYTGKAAAVMRAKGCAGAATIDSLIYRPELESYCAAGAPCAHPPCRQRCRHARTRFIGRSRNPDSIVNDADLVVVDEVSMVGRQMGEDLLSFRKPVLVLGDTAQLPPIGDGGFFTARKPDFCLTEIHRQARGSPVIELATLARQGLPLVHGRYGDSEVVYDIATKDMLSFDQVICGVHRSRHQLNQRIRRALGYRGPIPARGEKVLCLKNSRWKGLRIGTTWTVLDAKPIDDGFIAMTVEDEAGKSKWMRRRKASIRPTPTATTCQASRSHSATRLLAIRRREANGTRCSSSTRGISLLSTRSAGCTPQSPVPPNESRWSRHEQYRETEDALRGLGAATAGVAAADGGEALGELVMDSSARCRRQREMDQAAAAGQRPRAIGEIQ
jgi:exodeoxyribonuclease-5